MVGQRRSAGPKDILLVVACACLALAWSMAARGQTVFERLVMPGPLIEGHAKLEGDCANCHVPFAKGAQSNLCLDCHKPIARDLSTKKGMHGRRPDIVGRDCKGCHTDHKGRTADVVQLDRQIFNHTQTNFELKGAHKRTGCDGCHTAKVKFRDTPGRCFDCHKAVDRHKGRLGESCETCHNEEAWRQVKAFDHAKTKFPLQGAHKTVACAACHTGERYKDLAMTCISCHQIQDIHAGKRGAKCETCHGAESWKTIRFDHAKATRFALRGGHAKLKCESCHTGEIYRDKLSTTCVSCHKKNDPHAGQLGAQCEKCHNETGWRQKVAFDHDLTRFPLIGLHAVVACEDCHRTPSFKDVSRTCSGCHKDKHHEGRFGANCATCHNPNGWARWRFDHDKQTKFALTGAHAGLHCHACHRNKNVQRAAAPSTCYGCHSGDDKHQGQFGRSCEKCYSTTTFAQGATKR